MNRLPVAAFVALALATVGAFFLDQRLKATTPLIAGLPRPHPSMINPVAGGVCPLKGHRGVVPTSFREMKISFLLLNRADDVDVRIVTPGGDVVDTIATDRPMRVNHRVSFTWDGHRADGSVAPAGRYHIQVTLIHQHRTVLISSQGTGEVAPVTVETRPTPIRITHTLADGTEPAVFPTTSGRKVALRFTAAGSRRPTIDVYRTDVTGRPRLVNTFNATTLHAGFWAGNLRDGRPAPQGTYLMGLSAIDRFCTRTTFPTSFSPAAAPHSGVTVRYLAAQPPTTAVAPGAKATVEVDSRRHAYTWALRRVGSATVLQSGHSSATGLSVPMPGGSDGLYTLSLRWGAHTAEVPLITGVSAPPASTESGGSSASGSGRVLVVLPVLTWQGTNPVDDDGDGIPNELTNGGPVRLARPFAQGLPLGFADEAGLVSWLASTGRRVDLTTDLSLVADPTLLSRYSGLVLAGSETWLPTATQSALNTWVTGGGHVLSLGLDSLQRTVTVAGGEASDPSGAHAVDALSARPGPVRSTGGSLLLVQRDGLHLFAPTAQALSGFRRYQVFGPVQSPARLLTAVGVSPDTPAVIGYALGRGDVIDVGLPGFGRALHHDVTAQELVAGAWRVLTR